MVELTPAKTFTSEADILADFPEITNLAVGFQALHAQICWISENDGSIIFGTATPNVATGGRFIPLAKAWGSSRWPGCGYWKLLAPCSEGYEQGALVAIYRASSDATELSELKENDKWELLGAVLFTDGERDRLLNLT